MIGDDFVVIGATNGELLFLKLDLKNNSLTVHSSNNIHKGLINEIWNEQSRFTYVASSVSVKVSLFLLPEKHLLCDIFELH
jgi:hypothetical protein